MQFIVTTVSFKKAEYLRQYFENLEQIGESVSCTQVGSVGARTFFVYKVKDAIIKRRLQENSDKEPPECFEEFFPVFYGHVAPDKHLVTLQKEWKDHSESPVRETTRLKSQNNLLQLKNADLEKVGFFRLAMHAIVW